MDFGLGPIELIIICCVCSLPVALLAGAAVFFITRKAKDDKWEKDK